MQEKDLVQGINTDHLRHLVIDQVGSHSRCTQEDLLKVVHNRYHNVLHINAELALETLLEQLVEAKIISFQDNGRIKLTAEGNKLYQKQLHDPSKSKSKTTYRNKIPEDQIHEYVKGKVAELARLVGRTSAMEYEIKKGGPVKLDLVWLSTSIPQTVTHAFEVQHHGDEKNAIGNLEAAARYYSQCKLYIVVTSDKPVKKIKQLLGTKRDAIKIMTSVELEHWLGVLNTHEKILRPVLPAAKYLLDYGLW